MGFVHNRLETVELKELLVAAQLDADDASPQMNEIVRRFQPLAWKLACLRAKCSDLQWDLANAALIEIVRSVRAHNGEGSFPAYAKMRLKYAVSRECERWFVKTDLEEMPNCGPRLRTPRAPEIAQDPTVEELIPECAAWNGCEIDEAVAKLSDDRRHLLFRRYQREMSVCQIAADDGVTPSATTQRLSTAHRQLAELLAA